MISVSEKLRIELELKEYFKLYPGRRQEKSLFYQKDVEKNSSLRPSHTTEALKNLTKGLICRIGENRTAV